MGIIHSAFEEYCRFSEQERFIMRLLAFFMILLIVSSTFARPDAYPRRPQRYQRRYRAYNHNSNNGVDAKGIAGFLLKKAALTVGTVALASTLFPTVVTIAG